MKNNKLKVAELFAGVGGFRLGLEKNSNYQIVWSNQWEPSTKMQHASMVYEAKFGKENHSNEDINEVVTRNVEEIPDHDLLVGGFPCQDSNNVERLVTFGFPFGESVFLVSVIHFGLFYV